MCVWNPHPFYPFMKIQKPTWNALLWLCWLCFEGLSWHCQPGQRQHDKLHFSIASTENISSNNRCTQMGRGQQQFIVAEGKPETWNVKLLYICLGYIHKLVAKRNSDGLQPLDEHNSIWEIPLWFIFWVITVRFAFQIEN